MVETNGKRTTGPGGFPRKSCWRQTATSTAKILNQKNDLVHRPPEELVASILEKEQRITEIVGRIKSLLEKEP